MLRAANGETIANATSNPTCCSFIASHRKPNAEVLQLVRLGSHSELFA